MNLLLIGLRGAGKSTLGAALADRLGMTFIELDREALAAFDADTIAEVWQARGESAFRSAEVDALRQSIQSDQQVIALGGGAPTAPGAAQLIRAAQTARRAFVVYLRAEPAELRRRLEREGTSEDRPSLTGADPLDEIEEIFTLRDAFYRELADETLDAACDPEKALDRLGGRCRRLV